MRKKFYSKIKGKSCIIILITLIISSVNSSIISRAETENQSMIVLKNIWNGENWVSETTAEIDSTLRFNISITYHRIDPTGYILKWITITDTLPENLIYAYNATTTETSISPDGKTITWKPTIALGDGESFYLEFDANVIGYGTQTNLANVSAYETCPHVWHYKEANATLYVPCPGINVIKTASSNRIIKGEPIFWNITLENTGDSIIKDIIVVDSNLGTITTNLQLNTGEKWYYEYTTYPDTTITNRVDVNGKNPSNESFSDSDNATVEVINPSIVVTKTVNSETIYPGDPVKWNITLENTGDSIIKDIIVVDSNLGTITTNLQLNTGEKWYYNYTTNPIDDIVNIVSVNGTDLLGNWIAATDSASLNVIAPNINLEKHANKTTILPDKSVTYTYYVNNTGDVNLTNINILDDKLGDITNIIDKGDNNDILEPGENWIYQATTIITENTTNIANVTGEYEPGKIIFDEDTETIKIYGFKNLDIENDSIEEMAIDADNNPDNGYEQYTDPNGGTNSVVQTDGDNDNKIDHFINTTGDETPEKYWDPDDNILSNITIGDYDGDGKDEWGYDSDGDGTPDKYYDPDDNQIKDYENVKQIDIEPDGADESATDADNNPDNGYEQYTDPNGGTNSVVQTDGDNDNKIDHFINTTGDETPEKYWDPDDNITSDITLDDYDNDTEDEWGYDSDGDGTPDMYYDPNGTAPIDMEPPSKVEGLTVADAKDGKLDLSWNASTDNIAVAHYNIYWDQDGYTTPIATVDHLTLSYQRTGLTNGQTYTFKVSALDQQGNGGNKSDPVNGTPTKTESNNGGTNGNGQSGNGEISLNADFTWEQLDNLSVKFTDKSTGNIESWHWDFGDGETSNKRNVTHTYSGKGILTYTVTLTVSSETDSDTYTKQIQIFVGNNPPSIPTIQGPSTGNKNTNLTYTVHSTDLDNHSIQYTIDWGDGSIIRSENLPNGTNYTAIHQWTSAGRYTLWVGAEDELNSTSTTNMTVLIDAININGDGYLTDDDGDGIYDTFHGENGTETAVEIQSDGTYLIDIDGDGEWDTIFDTETQEKQEYIPSEGKEETDSLVCYTAAIILLIFLLILFYYLSRKKEEKPKKKSKKKK